MVFKTFQQCQGQSRPRPSGLKESTRLKSKNVRKGIKYRASAATHQMDGFGPPKAKFSRLLDVFMLHLWSTRPRREACLTSKPEIGQTSQ